MAVGDLGQLERVDARTVWPNEAQDFTPWLAEHLDLLGDAIGLDLERIDVEVPVGAFSLDILAESKAVGTVAIENQLTPTDHGHLGQLTTYAAGVDARAMVWVATSFRPEHLVTINWLNEWTESKIRFFAVEVRVLKIGDSLPAVDFLIVASPKEWSRTGGTAPVATTDDDGERKRRIAFFNRLLAEATTRNLRTSGSAGSVERSKSFPCEVGKSGFIYWVDLRKNGVLTVELKVWTGDVHRNEAIINALESDKGEVERLLGFRPELISPDPDGPYGRKKGSVMMVKGVAGDQPLSQVEESLQWCLDVLEGFQNRLEPRLAEIVLSLDAEEAQPIGESPASDDLH